MYMKILTVECMLRIKLKLHLEVNLNSMVGKLTDFYCQEIKRTETIESIFLKIASTPK